MNIIFFFTFLYFLTWLTNPKCLSQFKESLIFPFYRRNSCKYRTCFIKLSFLASPPPAIEILHRGNPKIAHTVIARIWRRACLSELPSFILIAFPSAGNSEIDLSSRHCHVKVISFLRQRTPPTLRFGHLFASVSVWRFKRCCVKVQGGNRLRKF